ncbi:MAG: VENN motif pre-toxin domain-containing protein, partial [Thermoplasmata archaeon]
MFTACGHWPSRKRPRVKVLVHVFGGGAGAVAGGSDGGAVGGATTPP